MTETETLTRVKISPPKNFYLIFKNDNVTTVDYVVMLLKTLFGKSQEECEDIINEVEVQGQSIVLCSTFEVVKTKKAMCLELNKQYKQQLQVVIEEE